MQRNCTRGITAKDTQNFIDALYDEDIHVKRIESLANATLGVISSGSLAVNTIGHGLALAKGRLIKHSIKQVDRLLFRAGIEVGEAIAHWVLYMVGARPRIHVGMDWADF